MSRQQTFEAPTLEAALARVADEVGHEASIVRAEKVRSGGIGGFFCRERFEVTAEAAEDPTGPRSLLDLADLVSDQESGAVVAPPPARSVDHPDFREVMRRVAADAGLLVPAGEPEAPAAVDRDVATAPPGSEVVRPAAPPVPPTAVAPPAHLGIARDLARLGLPAALVPDEPVAAGDSLAVRLLRRLETLPAPAPLPTTRGTVVAVVGGRREARELALELALESGGDVDDVVVAAPRARNGEELLTSVTAAADQRRSWRRRARPTFVAVTAPSSRDVAWGARVLDALEPSAVWAVVAADRKVEDVGGWLASLGPVDALAVHGVERTEAPGAVLALGVPVARLDGRRASAAAWTALLLDRVAA